MKFPDKANVTRHTVHPEDFGLTRHALSEIQGGNRDENALIIRRILDGSAPAAHLDASLYTTAMACYVSGKAPSINDGFILAKEALESGQSDKTFNKILQINAELSARGTPGMN